MSIEYKIGDCLEVLKGYPDDHFDSCVTDPPYGISFMGKDFDTFKDRHLDPGFCHWIAGFIDGEGCFSVHKKNVNGFETYDCQFAISVRADDEPILKRIQRELGIGTIAHQEKRNGANDIARFCVSAKAECIILRDLLRMFPLRAKKARDFELWSEALDEWLEHKPLEWESLAKVRDRLMAGRKYKPEGVSVDTYQMFSYRWAREVLRVLKPGGHLLAFGSPRTYHRMASGVEDAGFEVIDSMLWMHGQGFPKSANVSKNIDKHLGKERTEVVGHYELPRFYEGERNIPWHQTQENPWMNEGMPMASKERKLEITAPATPEALQWQGWGTALKPAYEPIVLARKPLIGTVAQNVLKHGTGGINVDACRIAVEGEKISSGFPSSIRNGNVSENEGWERPWKKDLRDYAQRKEATLERANSLGRWPSNLILDPESAKLLDEQSGELHGAQNTKGMDTDTRIRPPNIFGAGIGHVVGENPDFYNNQGGGASRFFYIAKASRSEREKGLKALPTKDIPYSEYRENFDTTKSSVSLYPDGSPRPMNKPKNIHPTVKPLELMRYLVRLITPKDGICLDPFLGSGTTLLACRLEGFNGLGIEKEADYEPIIRERLAYIPPALESFETEDDEQLGDREVMGNGNKIH